MLETGNIKKIVLTGGPCAGKTTIFNKLEKYLTQKGYYVITIPETATELIRSKILPCCDREHTLMFQNIALQKQYNNEMYAKVYADKIKEKNNVVILYDRAVFDNFAYLESQDDFEEILNKHNLDELSILHDYDLVIDLISTATCKKEAYELNGIRYETLEEAEKLDKKTSLAWLHHPNITTIKPTDDLNDKLKSVIIAVEENLNNINIKDINIYELSKESDLSIYNSTNSKTIDICTLYLKNNIVISKETYRDKSIFLMYYNDNHLNKKIITNEEFSDLICKNNVLFSEKIRKIKYVNNGDIYTIIIDSDHIYLECPKDISLELPLNLKLLMDFSLKITKYNNM